MELAGKAVLVTGGAIRLGRALSLALAYEGSCVVVHHHSSSRSAQELVAEIESGGGRADRRRDRLVMGQGT